MRLLLCGGGTAGHITPAIAIADELKKIEPKSEVLFIGRKGGDENEAVRKAGYNQRYLKIRGLKRSFAPDNMRRIIEAIKAQSDAKKILEEFKPDIVLGTGGYVCWPVINSARKMKIPTALHESNSTPGLTTKLLCRSCNMVFLGQEQTAMLLPKSVRTTVTGNPIKEEFFGYSRGLSRAELGLKENDIFILSFGGSIGAQKLNEVIAEVIESFSSKEKKVRHIHATGNRYFDTAPKKYKERETDGCRIMPYINNIPKLLSAADIVICRCGAMTLSEISAVGVAAILIPSPNVSANHQFLNGKVLADRGAAIMIEESDLTAERLICELNVLKNDKNERKNKAKSLKSLSCPNSAKMIINSLFLEINGKKKRD